MLPLAALIARRATEDRLAGADHTAPATGETVQPGAEPGARRAPGTRPRRTVLSWGGRTTTVQDGCRH
jgi:hypothetical protein